MSTEDEQVVEMRWELPRLRAVFRKCLIVHPDTASCDCLSCQCKLRSMLHTTRSQLCRDLDEITEMGSALTAVPATVRHDWKCPRPPDIGYFLSVINDCGEWCPHWFSDSHEIDYIPIEGPDSWPFVEQTARTQDWQRLGFTVFAN